MKKQRLIHVFVCVAEIIGIWIASRYLPPYLVHNPGMQLLALVFIGSEVAHFILHDK